MSSNAAAWLPSARADLVVGPAAMHEPGPGEILVRSRAVAVNPLDDVKQWTGDLMYRWLGYPAVLGEDVAGEVAAVGPGVTRFAVGDRVAAYAVGMERGRRHEAEGAFQLYVVVREDLATPLPDGLPYEQAAVLPLAVSTAATALFQDDQLALRSLSADEPPTGETVVVWGGSTSVGSNAIQLAVAAGYRVITTASPHNEARMRELGAELVVDYRDPAAVAAIVSGVEGSPLAGVVAIGAGSGDAAVRIAAAAGARRVALLSPPVAFTTLPRRSGPSIAFLRTMTTIGLAQLATQARARRHGIAARVRLGELSHDQQRRTHAVGAVLARGSRRGPACLCPRVRNRRGRSGEHSTRAEPASHRRLRPKARRPPVAPPVGVGGRD
ncbi:zinc-binding alcohol dehydrogenase family protein [Microbacterium plantarum]|uniref:Zinc-binding alcohol dehydrogenase family protein n=1 Tax=Microbacterium plantarum TaxID=1816425 RepID=A0ABV5ET52_9MICO